ncbi:MAG TPA: hypothetical protein PLX66_00190 [Bacilli bacterium]|nr:hypothetical protein [Bacilli bacterium]
MIKISSKAYVDYFEELAKKFYPKLYARLIRYDEVECLKRLKNIGYFCGMDYVGIPKLIPGDFYSRDDHSRVCAFLTLLYTGRFKQALAARFHDAGTYPFAHVRSFKEGNEGWQDADEMDVYTIISKDPLAKKLLAEDKIDIATISDVSKFPIVDKDRPALCIDRLDGILSSTHIWAKRFSLRKTEQLAKLVYPCFQYKNPNDYIIDEKRKKYGKELCIVDFWGKTIDTLDFFDAIHIYMSRLISKESRYSMALFGEILKFMDQKGIIPSDYFYLTEEEMIQLFINSPYGCLWEDFRNLKLVRKAMPSDDYTLNPKTKIRYCYPFLIHHELFGKNYPFELLDYEEYIGIEKAVIRNKGSLYADISSESKHLLLQNK